MDAFWLKIIAMVLMFLEHSSNFLYDFFPPRFPLYFETAGRIVGPLFFFLAVESFFHTRNRFRYLQRLYFAAVIMLIGNFLVEMFVQNYFHFENFFGVGHNIFFTIAFGVTTLFCFEWTKKQHGKWKKVFGIFLAVLSTFALLFSESTFIGVGLFYIFYFLRNRRDLMYLAYAFFCFLIFLVCVKQSIDQSWFFEYQWVMIFALPFMMLYNGKRGWNSKYLFYIFYPLHLWLLYIFAYVFGMRN